MGSALMIRFANAFRKVRDDYALNHTDQAPPGPPVSVTISETSTMCSIVVENSNSLLGRIAEFKSNIKGLGNV